VWGQSSSGVSAKSAVDIGRDKLAVRHDGVWEVAHGATPPLRDLARLYPSVPRLRFFADNESISPITREYTIRPDGALQTQSLADSLSVSLGSVYFDGMPSGASPPDPNGAVGTTQYVLIVNAEMTVYDKTTGQNLTNPTDTVSLWMNLPGGGECGDVDDGDGTVVFDRLAQRWIVQQYALGPLGSDDGPYYDCVAVSNSDDATGGWTAYEFGFNFGSTYFADYPKLGIWPTSYTGLAQGVYLLSFNIFSGPPVNGIGTFNGPDACFIDRSAMLSGTSATSNECYGFSSGFNFILPADLDGYTPPAANEPGFFMSWDNNENSVDLIQFVPCYPDCSQATLIQIAVPGFTPYFAIAAHGTNCGGHDGNGQCDIPEASGDGTYLDSLSDRPMYRLAYRNFGSHESLVFNHTVLAYFDQTNEVAGVRWYEIQDPSGTPVVAQAGTWSPGGYEWRWMGSTAMDSAGDQALGYSVSLGQLSGSPAPQIAITGRTPVDPQNTMEAEMVVAQSNGYQNGGDTRWGDYGSMALDPTDDCTFWYTQEYLPGPGYGTGNGVAHVVTFRFPNCVSDFSLSATPNSASVAPGTPAPFTLTIAPQGAFGSPISLSCSGLPTLASCAFSSATITPFASPTTTQLTITSAAPTASLAAPPLGHRSSSLYGIWLGLPTMLLSALALSKRKSKGPANFLLVYLLAIGCLAEVACGGSGNSSGGGGGGSAGTPAGTYTITVTGTAGSTQHTTTVTLTIQ
jgi:hypothetical protein